MTTPLLTPSAAKSAVLALANHFHEASELRRMLGKAARATGLRVSLAEYLETLARRSDLEAYCYRWAARVARGEDVRTVADAWNPASIEKTTPKETTSP
jgi:hypothetical protein